MNIPSLQTFQDAMEEAIGTEIATAAAAAEDFVRRNEAGPTEPVMTLTRNLEGFRMDETINDAVPLSEPPPAGEAGAGVWDALWVGAPLLGFLVAWRIRRRRGERV